MFGWSAPGAVELSGTWTSDLYLSETNGDGHVRPYQRLRAQAGLWQGRSGQSLEFQTSLRWTTDLANKLPGDPKAYIYSAYLKLNGAPRHTEWYLGRQFVYSGVGSAVLDGARIKYSLATRTRLDFFAGSSVDQLDPETVRSLSDFGVFGGRISYRAGGSTRLGLGWLLRKSEGQTTTHKGGVDVEHRTGVARFFGRTSFNAEQLRVADVLARLALTPRGWYLSAEYSVREPSVDANSVFSIIRFDRYRDARFIVRRKLTSRISAVTELDIEFYDPENSYRIRVGLQSGWYAASWYHQTGYRGDRTGVMGNAHVKFFRQWTGFGQINISRYRVQDEQVDRSDAYTSSVGAIWRLPKSWQVSAEMQYLRNAVESNDNRILLRVIKSFSYKPAKSGEDR